MLAFAAFWLGGMIFCFTLALQFYRIWPRAHNKGSRLIGLIETVFILSLFSLFTFGLVYGVCGAFLVLVEASAVTSAVTLVLLAILNTRMEIRLRKEGYRMH